MTLALHRDFRDARLRSRAVPAPGSAAPSVYAEAAAHAAYGKARPNWLVVALIVALHAAGLVGLAIALDVVPVLKARRGPVTVELIPEPLAPPPKPAAPSAAHKSAALTTPPPPMIAATPIVASATPAIFVPPAAPAPPVASAPVAVAVAAPPAPPAPIVPPDVDASTGRNVPPEYPIESRRRREQGVVRLRVTITAEGRVRSIEVARTSGYDRLDQAALRAVKTWLFHPGTQAGVPVEAVGALSIPFRLT